MEENNSFKLPQLTPLPTTVEDCHDFIKRLLETISGLFKRVEKLEYENKELKERLNNNSSNSSLPPSKDFKKKKKNKKPTSKNKNGGQIGHKGHYRELVDSEKVDAIINCNLPRKCICGEQITLKDSSQRHQVYELPEPKLHITEYRLEKGCCFGCGKSHIALLPEGITWGITGPKLTSFMSHLVSKYQLSRRELKEFLRELYSFNISLGTVFNKQKIVNPISISNITKLFCKKRNSYAFGASIEDFITNFTIGRLSLKTLFFMDEKSERTGMYSQRVFKLNRPIVKFQIEGTSGLRKLRRG
jgi:transposase